MGKGSKAPPSFCSPRGNKSISRNGSRNTRGLNLPIVLVVAAALFIAFCASKFDWEDTTGQEDMTPPQDPNNARTITDTSTAEAAEAKANEAAEAKAREVTEANKAKKIAETKAKEAKEAAEAAETNAKEAKEAKEAAEAVATKLQTEAVSLRNAAATTKKAAAVTAARAKGEARAATLKTERATKSLKIAQDTAKAANRKFKELRAKVNGARGGGGGGGGDNNDPTDATNYMEYGGWLWGMLWDFIKAIFGILLAIWSVCWMMSVPFAQGVMVVTRGVIFVVYWIGAALLGGFDTIVKGTKAKEATEAKAKEAVKAANNLTDESRFSPLGVCSHEESEPQPVTQTASNEPESEQVTTTGQSDLESTSSQQSTQSTQSTQAQRMARVAKRFYPRRKDDEE